MGARTRLGAMPQHWGGCSGRCDAVVGAVEAQKAITLHVHFKLFIQSAHQFMTLAQIAAL